jgi:adenylate cyclase
MIADAYGLLSVLCIARRDFDRAIAEGERAVAMTPNSADAFVYLGMSLRWAGLPERAIPILEKAVRLNPFPQTWYYLHLGAAYREAGHYEESLAALQKAIQREPDNLFAYIGLCGVYELMGREDEARAMVAEVYRVDPKFSLTRFEKTFIQKDEEIKKKFIDSLRKAGLK